MRNISREHRRRSRRDYVDQFLLEFHVDFGLLAESTQKELSDWARYIQLVEDQPSANWRAVVLHLCVAVESQLAAGLGTVQRLAFLAKEKSLGWKVGKLEGLKFDSLLLQQIVDAGIDPEFVRSRLAELLRRLAAARNPKIHGRAFVQSFTPQDEAEVRQLAGQILRGIVGEGRVS